ncbi:MAG: TonB-dependent receptor [Rhodospirillaceae bacterium]|nr:TonB-dependent receptor [Rhodospirillaceae bacterium]
MDITSRLCARPRGEAPSHTARRGVRTCLLASVFSFFPLAHAFAQSATNVATVAVDAFGEKVGSEQIGLYNEQAVRGFSLQDSGNYRLDGAYFIRSANIVPLTLDGTTIRVGINALGVDFPAPSGIVEYRLATAAPGMREEFEASPVRDYGGHAWLLKGSAATGDGVIGAAYGVNIMNDTGYDGQKRRPRHFAFVPTWRPGDKFQVRGMFSADRFYKPGGDYGFVLSGTTLPDAMPVPNRYWAEWAHFSQWQFAAGAIARYNFSDRAALQTSFVWTKLDRWRQDFTTLTIDGTGTGTATVVRGRESDASSKAVETRLHWQVTDGQRVFGTLRWRVSDSNFRPGAAVPLGFFDMDAGLPTSMPAPAPLPDAAPTFDETRQVMAGIGYEADLTDSVWVRGAVLKTRYEKDRTPPGQATLSNQDSPWLYDLAATFTPTESLTLFATTVRGLEESGTAPSNAANRNEVLPAVLATQYELGLRYRISPAMTFIGSLFEIEKPTPGLDANNVYGLIGDARHRGLELSFVGRPTSSINIVSGLVLLDADRRGALIDRGVLIGRAVGVSKLNALLNVTYQLPVLKGLSIDGQVNYYSKMLLNPRAGVYTPGYATLDLGLRYSFQLGDVPATLRARMGNVFDEDTWTANRNETLNRMAPRAFRLSLTTNFNH